MPQWRRFDLILAGAVITMALLLPRDAPTLIGTDINPRLQTLTSIDIATIARLHDLLTSERGRQLLQKSDRMAVATFYGERDFALLWIENGEPNTRARAAIDVLASAGAEGLDPGDFIVPVIARGADAKALADAELQITASVLAYARQAENGRIPFSRVSPEIAYERKVMGASEVLARLLSQKDVAETISSFNPPHRGYRALKEKLADLRTQDGAVVDRSSEVIGTILTNMERWRWMARDLGANHVMVNIPDYTQQVVRDDMTIWTTKIVVGERNTPTPIFSGNMTSITLNPIWNIPQSIADKEYLHALEEHPDYLHRVGLRTVQRSDGSLHVYQLPNEMNPLGHIRFNFPNKFTIYQHDTPDKYLFERSVRTESHGCIRIEKPLTYAEMLLAIALPEEGYSKERLYGLTGGVQEDNIEFPQAILVHLTYQTAFVDQSGQLQIRDDIYGIDARMRALLNAPKKSIGATIVEESLWQKLLKAPVRARGRVGRWISRWASG